MYDIKFLDWESEAHSTPLLQIAESMETLRESDDYKRFVEHIGEQARLHVGHQMLRKLFDDCTDPSQDFYKARTKFANYLHSRGGEIEPGSKLDADIAAIVFGQTGDVRTFSTNDDDANSVVDAVENAGFRLDTECNPLTLPTLFRIHASYEGQHLGTFETPYRAFGICLVALTIFATQTTKGLENVLLLAR